MEKKGLVKKVRDMDRKNMIRVAITEKGQQAYDQSTQRTTIHNIMSALSEAERQQLMSYLQRLGDRALKELGEYYKPPFS
jgi:DNA-binding MarR family transcriptional regulator